MPITRLPGRELDAFDLYLLTTIITCKNVEAGDGAPQLTRTETHLRLTLSETDITTIENALADDDFCDEWSEIAIICLQDELRQHMDWAWADEADVGVELLTALRSEDLPAIAQLARNGEITVRSEEAHEAAERNLPVALLAQI